MLTTASAAMITVLSTVQVRCWRKVLENSEYSTIDEIAKAESVNPSYISRVLRLTLLGPRSSKGFWTGVKALTCKTSSIRFQSAGVIKRREAHRNHHSRALGGPHASGELLRPDGRRIRVGSRDGLTRWMSRKADSRTRLEQVGLDQIVSL
jgi:hypothetical protein